MISASGGRNAGAESQRDLVEDGTKTANQRFERIFRIRAFLVRPEDLFYQLIIRHDRVILEDQILQKRQTLA